MYITRTFLDEFQLSTVERYTPRYKRVTQPIYDRWVMGDGVVEVMVMMVMMVIINMCA